jgi:hypothetical protein
MAALLSSLTPFIMGRSFMTGLAFVRFVICHPDPFFE